MSLRYFSTDEIVFTNRDGKSFTIKELREFPEYSTLLTLPITGDESLDEIASRDTIYGEGSETLSYMILEHNITEIMNADFDLTKLQSLRIPNSE